ncbi:MAG: SRPBCC family protein [Melioribacteraceae bacterium]|nr:SRPBCC family protein [Melioribacteraceae bacterium]
MYNLYREQIVNKPLEEVFAFFEKPENLEVITPKWMKFKIKTPPPLIMKVGAEFDYKIDLMKIPLKWKTIITEYAPPYKFVDVQKKGPYKKWIHTHTFETIGDKTKITDNVDYEIPAGILGSILNKIYIGKTLKAIFDFRETTINRMFNSNELIK